MPEQPVLNTLAEQSRAIRQNVLLFAIAVAVFYGFWFCLACLKLGNHLLAIIDFAMGILFLATGWYAVRNPLSDAPGYIVATSSFIFFFYLFASGGISGIGPLWSFIVPLTMFFLTGFRSGLIYSVVYLVFCIGVFTVNFYRPGLFYQHPPFLSKDSSESSSFQPLFYALMSMRN